MSLLPPTPRPQDVTSPDWWLMLRKFAQHGTSIASFVPSSRFLARMTCKGIDYDAARCIVELGAGTGPITQELVRPGLPLPSFPAPLRDAIIASSARALAPGGTFRQLTNMPWVYRGLYRGYFGDVRFKLVR